MRHLTKRLDLQAKVSLVLVAVIVPTFLIVTIAENKLTLPILEEEVKQVGIHSGKTLAAQIDSARMLSSPNPTPAIESALQDLVYSQPDIVRIDVATKDPTTNSLKLIASNVEDDPMSSPPEFMLVDAVVSEYRLDENGGGQWDISVPLEHKSRDPRGPRKLMGIVHVVVSTKLVARIAGILWKTTATAAGLSVISLILVLSYFLRKTISNDRLLRKAENENLQLTEQLHDAQRQIMTNEKLAVMGQLAASFAHEIGTPLNAVGGHLQLLREEIPAGVTKTSVDDRLEIVNGQLNKIENIVKGFLQSTSKPTSQRQLVDLNHLIEKSLGIVMPRIDALKVEVQKHLDRKLGPFRSVPLDLEQVFLNLFNNSLDSIQAKSKQRGGRFVLEVNSELKKIKDRHWVRVSIYDTGQGILKEDLVNVMKPFFTTKRAGEGTGLGLTICQQTVRKYGGDLAIESKEGAWTKVVINLPYHVEL